MKNLKSQFPVTSQYVHLNTASSGLMSETLLDFRQNHDLDYLIMGSKLKDKQAVFLTKVRESVGKFFSCETNQVALVPNFSFGFNTVLEGLPREKKVLLLKQDYPSINWAVESRAFPICYTEINEHLEDNILQAVEKEKPDVFAFSLVQYIDGLQIDFEFIKQLKDNFPNLLLVADGTQYCGVEKFDFKNSGLDILGASAYKWMNAGYGNGFFLFKETVKDKIFPKATGFNSIRGKYKEGENSLIGKFEPGHQDTLNFGSLKSAIELIGKVGINTIEDQIATLKNEAKQAFAERGLLEKKIINRKIHSSIFNIKGDEKLFNQLRERDIICSQRGDGIRVSFHYFNTQDDLKQLLQVIKH